MCRIVVTAEAFGYGPIITCLNVIRYMKKNTNLSYIFIGSGVALEQAKTAEIFSRCIECETFLIEKLNQCEAFNKAEWVISFENVIGAILAVRKKKHVLYVDNLFWMWDELPKELTRVDNYYVVESFNIEENLKRIGKRIERIEIVGPLRVFQENQISELHNRIVFNLGGTDSPLVNFKVIKHLYSIIIRDFMVNLEDSFKGEIIFCGGSRIINFLKKEHNNTKAIFVSLPNNEYLRLMKSSKYLILSPGLGNFFEAMTVDQEVYMLPPINYSQFLQLNYYMREDVGIRCMNWNSFKWYTLVKPYVEERVGVEMVKCNIESFIQDGKAHKMLSDSIMYYIQNSTSEWYKNRNKFMNRYSRTGIEEAGNSMIRRITNAD